MFEGTMERCGCHFDSRPLCTGLLGEGLSQTYDSFLIHTIRETDTLLGISMRYDVPLADLKRFNALNSQEIWFRKQLRVPQHSAHKGILAEVQQPRSESAAESSRVSALKKLVHLEEMVLRELLKSQVGDFQRTLSLAEWVERVSKPDFLPNGTLIDPREALAYLQMNSCDKIAAEKNLRADVLWEEANVAPEIRSGADGFTRFGGSLGKTMWSLANHKRDRQAINLEREPCDLDERESHVPVNPEHDFLGSAFYSETCYLRQRHPVQPSLKSRTIQLTTQAHEWKTR